MKSEGQRFASVTTIVLIALLAFATFAPRSAIDKPVSAQVNPTPTPAAVEFDQQAALTKIRDRIKGREKEPASAVFKNIQTMKTVPAGRLLAIMEFGYARSLGVNCTHCHTPDKWEAEDKSQKQTARDMSAMVAKINGELLKSIKNLKSETPTINCTTCHRGEVKPALNMPAPK